MKVLLYTCPLTPNTMQSIGLPSLKIRYSQNQQPQTNAWSGMYCDAESKEYQNNYLLQKYPCVSASWCVQSCTLTDTWKNPQRQTASQAADRLRLIQKHFFLSLGPGVLCQLSAGKTRILLVLQKATPWRNSPVHLKHENCSDLHSVQSTKPDLCFVFLVKSVMNFRFQEIDNFLLCK